MSGRLKLRVHDDAVADLAEIAEYLGYHNHSACLRFQEQVGIGLSGLQSLPRRGRRVNTRSELFAELRATQIPRFRNYIIFYSIERDEVVVLRVMHAALRRSLDEMPPARGERGRS